MPAAVLGLDVGGANLKAAHTAGPAHTLPFALWKDPAGLPSALRALLRPLPPFDLLALTMTGELCDCFVSKRQGVLAILDAVAAVADGVPVRVWQTDGRFVDLEAARANPLLAAAANWLAVATFAAARYAPSGPALLIDVGSTTTDIVPLLNGKPVPRGRTDPERLRCHELVYTGGRRTPVCALLGAGSVAELFATMLDVRLVLFHEPEDANDCDTADGRPATIANAHARLARMLGADLETSTLRQRLALARRVDRIQMRLLRRAAERVAATLPGPPETVILSGSAEMVGMIACAPLLSAARVVRLSAELGGAVSQAACAHAVAFLAAEESSNG